MGTAMVVNIAAIVKAAISSTSASPSRPREKRPFDSTETLRFSSVPGDHPDVRSTAGGQTTGKRVEDQAAEKFRSLAIC